ncbi:12232_t:CDS:2 [Ambispora gerdemannii]|uniref:12232_t:CDS:1 n=1 Tax=Ambispora gerdemannii TaxID=144530 RepID=A0A9N9AAP5_9GLOM|nr:12232_t:CDS:2 [Ambispora gerdemannii]
MDKYEEALPSVFFRPSEPSFLPRDSLTSQGDSSYAGDDTFLTDSWDEGDKDITEQDKWNLIDEWLKKFYKNKLIPPFERNSATASALYELAVFNIKQDAMAEITLKNLKVHAMEYSAEAKRINDILETMSVPKEELSKNGSVALNTLSSLAITLGLGDVESSSFIQALAQLNINTARAERKHKNATRAASALETRIKEANIQKIKLSRLLSNLRDNWDSMEEQKLREWRKNTDTLTQKGCEYQDRLSRLEKQYTSMNIEEGGLRLEKLKQQQERVIAMEKEVKIKSQKLRNYQDMPPDIKLATLKLHEAKEKLNELKINREELLSNMAENVW